MPEPKPAVGGEKRCEAAHKCVKCGRWEWKPVGPMANVSAYGFCDQCLKSGTGRRTREREALEAAHNALATAVITSNGYARDKFTSDEEETACENAHAAIIAYGRAVREADKEAALGQPPAQTGSTDKYNAAWISGNWKGRREAAAAIEALDSA